ncbi:MAG: phospholipase D-like domain-containing protein [archaeon]|nr:hypothetical protein [Nanoarchaeota archaeon]
MKKKFKTKVMFLFIVLVAVMGYLGFNGYIEIDSFERITSGAVVSDEDVTPLISGSGAIQVYFCPHQSCEQALLDLLDSAEETIHCASYELSLESVQEKLLEKRSDSLEVDIIVDDNYLKKFNYSFIKTDGWGQMHNKFCIIDGSKIFTGSMNPTNNGVNKNNNNLLIIDSPLLATNYENEFQEMWTDETYKKGEPVPNSNLILEVESSVDGEVGTKSITVKNYFCPDDNCAEHVKEELEKAEESIYFMTFSFTHDGIANVILLRMNDGVEVHGVFETTQVSQYSKYEVLEYQGADVVKDGNGNNMHHKVFIIDGKTVITGSMNPSKNGDESNDENVLIIYSEEIAALYLEEFDRVYAEAVENS